MFSVSSFAMSISIAESTNGMMLDNPRAGGASVPASSMRRGGMPPIPPLTASASESARRAQV